MKNFLIIGLPRSMTAWLSNYFTMPGISFCHHDGLIVFKTVHNMADFFKTREGLMGNSDPTLCRCADDVIDVQDDFNILIVDRDEDTTRESYRVAISCLDADSDMIMDDCIVGLHKIKTLTDNVCVKFESLMDKKRFRKIHQYILGDIPFDEGRYDLLRDLIVTQNIEEVSKRWL